MSARPHWGTGSRLSSLIGRIRPSQGSSSCGRLSRTQSCHRPSIPCIAHRKNCAKWACCNSPDAHSQRFATTLCDKFSKSMRGHERNSGLLLEPLTASQTERVTVRSHFLGSISCFETTSTDSSGIEPSMSQDTSWQVLFSGQKPSHADARAQPAAEVGEKWSHAA